MNPSVTEFGLQIVSDALHSESPANWLVGLVVVLPGSFGLGLFSCWMFRGRRDSSSIDFFRICAWLAAVLGLVACSISIVIRPSIAHFPFMGFMFGLGSVVAFRLHRHLAKNGRSQRDAAG